MKNYDETISTVFERIQNYKQNKARKKKKIMRIVLPVFGLCLSIAVVTFALKGDVFKSEPPTIRDDSTISSTSTQAQQKDDNLSSNTVTTKPEQTTDSSVESTVTNSKPSSTTESKPGKPQQTTNSSVESTVTNSKPSKPEQNNVDTTSKVDTEIKKEKTIINVDAQTAKIGFIGSDGAAEKYSHYVVDKVSAGKKYIENDMQSRDLNVFGIEYKDVPYYQSKKNQYTGITTHKFKNDTIEFSVNSDGIVDNFYPLTPMNVFPNESKHSEELAKKYLDMIMPNYEYDTVRTKVIGGLHIVIYEFFKELNGIRTSDSVGIALNFKGYLEWYSIGDVGKYDNIEIKNFNIDDFLQRINEIVKEVYGKGESIVDYKLDEETAPRFSIFLDDKIELTVPIEISIKATDGLEYETLESVVFELN